MSVFVDTNVLLRAADPGDAKHEAAVTALAALVGSGEVLAITPQIAAEFWNVATRPVQNNGLDMSIDEARNEMVRLEGFFLICEESVDVYAEWKRLVVAHAVKGVQVHDTRIVAAMNVYGIRRIVTFNGDDFQRYKDIEVIVPS
jgi:predicted nucleic acid-binding protein